VTVSDVFDDFSIGSRAVQEIEIYQIGQHFLAVIDF